MADLIRVGMADYKVGSAPSTIISYAAMVLDPVSGFLCMTRRPKSAGSCISCFPIARRLVQRTIRLNLRIQDYR